MTRKLYICLSLTLRTCRVGGKKKKSLDLLSLHVCLAPKIARKTAEYLLYSIVVNLLWYYAAVNQEIKEQLVSVGPLEAWNVSAFGHQAPSNFLLSVRLPVNQ